MALKGQAGQKYRTQKGAGSDHSAAVPVCCSSALFLRSMCSEVCCCCVVCFALWVLAGRLSLSTVVQYSYPSPHSSVLLWPSFCP